MDKIELKRVMKKFGDTQTDLAEALCISRTRLNSKINERNDAAFTQPEISLMRERYNLSASELETIFFAKRVS